jgi:hypothetical protein
MRAGYNPDHHFPGSFPELNNLLLLSSLSSKLSNPPPSAITSQGSLLADLGSKEEVFVILSGDTAQTIAPRSTRASTRLQQQLVIGPGDPQVFLGLLYLQAQKPIPVPRVKGFCRSRSGFCWVTAGMKTCMG